MRSERRRALLICSISCSGRGPPPPCFCCQSDPSKAIRRPYTSVKLLLDDDCLCLNSQRTLSCHNDKWSRKWEKASANNTRNYFLPKEFENVFHSFLINLNWYVARGPPQEHFNGAGGQLNSLPKDGRRQFVPCQPFLATTLRCGCWNSF